MYMRDNKSVLIITCLIWLLIIYYFIYCPCFAKEVITKELKTPDGQSVKYACLFPGIRNKGGSDGSGLCVFTSVEIAARSQGIYELYGFQEFMRKHPGGGWPEKLDRMIQEFTNRAPIKYVHLLGTAQQEFPLLEQSYQVGFIPCVTWGTDESHYKGRRIAHMVNAVYVDKNWVGILDNNFPHEILWVDTQTAINNMGLGKFWGCIFYQQPAVPYEVTRHVVGQCSGGRCVVPSYPPVLISPIIPSNSSSYRTAQNHTCELIIYYSEKPDCVRVNGYDVLIRGPYYDSVLNSPHYYSWVYFEGPTNVVIYVEKGNVKSVFSTNIDRNRLPVYITFKDNNCTLDFSKPVNWYNLRTNNKDQLLQDLRDTLGFNIITNGDGELDFGVQRGRFQEPAIPTIGSKVELSMMISSLMKKKLLVVFGDQLESVELQDFVTVKRSPKDTFLKDLLKEEGYYVFNENKKFLGYYKTANDLRNSLLPNAIPLNVDPKVLLLLAVLLVVLFIVRKNNKSN